MADHSHLPIARFMQMEGNMTKVLHELNRLMEIAVSHGAAIKDTNNYLARAATKVELSAAVSSIKYGKLSSAIRGDVEEEDPTKKTIEELKIQVTKLKEEGVERENFNRSEIAKLRGELAQANYKLNLFQKNLDVVVNRKEKEDLSYFGVDAGISLHTSINHSDSNTHNNNNNNKNNNNNNSNTTTNNNDNNDNYSSNNDSNDNNAINNDNNNNISTNSSSSKTNDINNEGNAPQVGDFSYFQVEGTKKDVGLIVSHEPIKTPTRSTANLHKGDKEFSNTAPLAAVTVDNSALAARLSQLESELSALKSSSLRGKLASTAMAPGGDTYRKASILMQSVLASKAYENIPGKSSKILRSAIQNLTILNRSEFPTNPAIDDRKSNVNIDNNEEEEEEDNVSRSIDRSGDRGGQQLDPHRPLVAKQAHSATSKSSARKLSTLLRSHVDSIDEEVQKEGNENTNPYLDSESGRNSRCSDNDSSNDSKIEDTKGTNNNDKIANNNKNNSKSSNNNGGGTGQKQILNIISTINNASANNFLVGQPSSSDAPIPVEGGVKTVKVKVVSRSSNDNSSDSTNSSESETNERQVSNRRRYYDSHDDDNVDYDAIISGVEESMRKLTTKTETNTKYIDEIKGVLKLVDFEHHKILSYMSDFNKNNRDSEAAVYYSIDQLSNLIGTCFQLIEKQNISGRKVEKSLEDLSLVLENRFKSFKDSQAKDEKLHKINEDVSILMVELKALKEALGKKVTETKKVILGKANPGTEKANPAIESGNPQPHNDIILDMLPDLTDFDQILGEEDRTSVDVDLLLQYLRQFSMQYREVITNFQTLSESYFLLMNSKGGSGDHSNQTFRGATTPNPSVVKRFMSPTAVTIGGADVVSLLPMPMPMDLNSIGSDSSTRTPLSSRQKSHLRKGGGGENQATSMNTAPSSVKISRHMTPEKDRHGHIYDHGKDGGPSTARVHDLDAVEGSMDTRIMSARSATPSRSASIVLNISSAAASSPRGQGKLSAGKWPSNSDQENADESNNNSNNNRNNRNRSPKKGAALDNLTDEEPITEKLSVFEDIGKDDFVAIDMKTSDNNKFGGYENFVAVIEDIALGSDLNKNGTIQAIRMDINFIKNKLAQLSKGDGDEKARIHQYIQIDMKQQQQQQQHVKIVGSVGGDLPASASINGGSIITAFPPNALKVKRASPPRSAPAHHGDKDKAKEKEKQPSVGGVGAILQAPGVYFDDSRSLAELSNNDADLSKERDNSLHIRKMFEKKSPLQFQAQSDNPVSFTAIEQASMATTTNATGATISSNPKSQNSNALGEMARKIELMALRDPDLDLSNNSNNNILGNSQMMYPNPIPYPTQNQNNNIENLNLNFGYMGNYAVSTPATAQGPLTSKKGFTSGTGSSQRKNNAQSR